jgi:valyl-tRNA synthetase
MKVGRRLAIKVLNASRFVLGFPPVDSGDLDLVSLVTEPVDLAMLASLRELVEVATAAFEGFDYARALERTEAFFWNFCDNHVELVKVRAYGEGDGARSARAALQLGLSTLLRLFAPCLPFVTEEVWSWWQEGSIHLAPWPDTTELEFSGSSGGQAEVEAGGIDPRIGEIAARVLSELRRAKTEAKLNMKASIDLAVVRLPESDLDAFLAAASDLADAGTVQEWDIAVAEEFSVEARGLAAST